MGKRAPPKEYRFVETDGQVYLVRDRGVWRFPTTREKLPFLYTDAARMDFGMEVVHRANGTRCSPATTSTGS